MFKHLFHVGASIHPMCKSCSSYLTINLDGIHGVFNACSILSMSAFKTDRNFPVEKMTRFQDRLVSGGLFTSQTLQRNVLLAGSLRPPCACHFKVSLAFNIQQTT